MSTGNSQALWARGGSTVRSFASMRLAPKEKERLWKGLERFVNCGDSLEDFQALAKAFPAFWPVKMWHYVNDKPVSLNWNPACHWLFLNHRDSLRYVWPLRERTLFDRTSAFLLGITEQNESARENARKHPQQPAPSVLPPHSSPLLVEAWREILATFPGAEIAGRSSLGAIWESGEFCLFPQNEFQQAFYLLFRQSWKARVCPRCKTFFVAREPKKTFCGTGCSAGNRLASKRDWWNRVGAKRRTSQRQKSSNSHKERNSR